MYINHMMFSHRDPNGAAQYKDYPPALRIVHKLRSADVIFLRNGVPEYLSYLQFNKSSDWKFSEDSATCYDTGGSYDENGEFLKMITYTFENSNPKH